jgi:ubiquinone/menaquinone biosynthesis C-methylase UbiE
MPSPFLLLAAGLGLAIALALAYYLLAVTEGAYLGPRVVRWLYDRGAPTYDGVKAFDRIDELACLANPLFNRLEETAGADALVLDVATGTARLPLALFDVGFFEGEVVGIDASRGMLAEAARKTAPLAARVHLLHHPAAPLPFTDAAFDAVTMLEALEFLPDQGAALAEMVRVLRPGGWLLASHRRGIDAWLMPGRVGSAAAFERRLAALGLVDIETRPWQSYYDLVWARRPGKLEPRPDRPGWRNFVIEGEGVGPEKRTVDGI